MLQRQVQAKVRNISFGYLKRFKFNFNVNSKFSTTMRSPVSNFQTLTLNETENDTLLFIFKVNKAVFATQLTVTSFTDVPLTTVQQAYANNS